MATIKEDPHAWKVRGLLKRDFQHSHDEPEEIPYKKKGDPKKNKWCRKKVGQEHDYSQTQINTYGRLRRVNKVCRRCGKTDWSGGKYQRLTEITVGGQTQEVWI